MERCDDYIPRVKQQIDFRLIFSQLAVLGDYLRCDMQHVRLAYQMLDFHATIARRNKSLFWRKQKIVGLKARFSSGARWRQLKASTSLSSENCMFVEKSFFCGKLLFAGNLWHFHYAIQRQVVFAAVAIAIRLNFIKRLIWTFTTLCIAIVLPH